MMKSRNGLAFIITLCSILALYFFRYYDTTNLITITNDSNEIIESMELINEHGNSLKRLHNILQKTSLKINLEMYKDYDNVSLIYYYDNKQNSEIYTLKSSTKDKSSPNEIIITDISANGKLTINSK